MPGSALLMTWVSLILISSVIPAPSAAQWSAKLELGAERFWGGSIENAPEHRSFRPYRPTTFGVGLARQSGRLGLGLQLQYAKAGLALEGADAVAAAKGVFTIYSASPEVSYCIVSLETGSELMLHAGPLLELWHIVDQTSRTRVGVQTVVSLDVALGGSLAASILAGVAISGSPFEVGELDPSYDLRALWRRRFAVALKYRL